MRIFLTCLALTLATTAHAQERQPSHCIAVAEAPGVEYIHRASFNRPLPDFTVRLTYVNHATFMIEAPDGTTVATDYTGFLGNTDHIPTIVTMNNAHGTHFTNNPDPRIPHVLRGWGDGTGPADHYIEVGEVRVRNVTTDIRSRFGDTARPDANSIFVFEVAGLCIAHLGHLHHIPTEAQFAALGRMDVVMAPVDGGYTLDLPSMIGVLKRARASVVIPMHWFSLTGLDRFLAGMVDEFEIEVINSNSIEVSLRALPTTPTIRVLAPAYLRDSLE